jgi:NADH-quinone oxidoreductase subunit N
VINSAVGAYYYLRIIVVMYMRESRKEVPIMPVPIGLAGALAISAAATIYLGVLPNSVLRYAQHSAQEMVQQSAPMVQQSAPPGTATFGGSSACVGRL